MKTGHDIVKHIKNQICGMRIKSSAIPNKLCAVVGVEHSTRCLLIEDNRGHIYSIDPMSVTEIQTNQIKTVKTK